MPLIPACRRQRRADLSSNPTWSTKSSRTAIATEKPCLNKNKTNKLYIQTSIKDKKNKQTNKKKNPGVLWAPHIRSLEENFLLGKKIHNVRHYKFTACFYKVLSIYYIPTRVYFVRCSQRKPGMAHTILRAEHQNRPRRHNLNIGLHKAKITGLSQSVLSILGHRCHR